MIPCAYPAIQYIMRWQKYPITSDLPVLGLHLFLASKPIHKIFTICTKEPTLLHKFILLIFNFLTIF